MKTIAAAALALAWLAAPPGGFRSIASHRHHYTSNAAFPVSSPEWSADRKANTLRLATADTVHLLVLAGPAAKMMSFQIDALTNPTLEVPVGAKLRFDVVNVDDDMAHDLRLTAQPPPYGPRPGAGMAGTAALAPHDARGYAATSFEVQATRPGVAYYLCTVAGHAAAGMFGKILVH